jgi:hypothetical protein
LPIAITVVGTRVSILVIRWGTLICARIYARGIRLKMKVVRAAKAGFLGYVAHSAARALDAAVRRNGAIFTERIPNDAVHDNPWRIPRHSTTHDKATPGVSGDRVVSDDGRDANTEAAAGAAAVNVHTGRIAEDHVVFDNAIASVHPPSSRSPVLEDLVVSDGGATAATDAATADISQVPRDHIVLDESIVATKNATAVTPVL